MAYFEKRNRLLGLSIYFLLICNFSGCRHAGYSKPTDYFDPSEADFSSIRMGQGFNSLGGPEYSSELSRCVEPSSLVSFGGSPAPRIVIRIEHIDSQKSLESSLSQSQDLNASVSKGKAVLFKAGLKSSSKFSFVFSEKTSYVILNVSSTFAPEVMDNFTMAANVIPRFAESPQTFFKTCGDRFVSGVRKAAGVIAVMRCETASATEKEALESKIKAEGGFKALTASAEIQTLMDTVRGKSTDGCHIEVDSYGGVGNYDFKDKATLVDSAVNYVTKSTQATATPVEFETMPYTAIIDAGFNSQVLSKIDLEFVDQRKYATYKNKIIDDILKGVSLAGSVPDPQNNLLNHASAMIKAERDDLKRCFSRIYDPEACREKSFVQLPDRVILKPMQH